MKVEEPVSRLKTARKQDQEEVANMFADLVEEVKEIDVMPSAPATNPGFNDSIHFNPMMDGEGEQKMNIDDTLPDFGDDIIGSGEPNMLDSNAN